MSEFGWGSRLQRLVRPLFVATGNVRTINSQSITELAKDGAGMITDAKGAVVVTDGGAGFAVGCTYTKTDGTGTTIKYINVGSTSACEFRPAELATQSALSGAGAVPITARTCLLTTTGANALTLANGFAGQRLTIIMVVDGGDGTLTPTTKTGFTTIVFDAVADAVTLEYVTTLGWMVVENRNSTIS